MSLSRVLIRYTTMAATPARWRLSLFALIFAMCHLALPARAFSVGGCKAAVVPCDRSRGVNHRTPPTALLLAKKDIDSNGEGGSAKGQFNVDIFKESNRPALTFFVTLTLWHFWIGPYLRPIILAARDR